MRWKLSCAIKNIQLYLDVVGRRCFNSQQLDFGGQCNLATNKVTSVIKTMSYHIIIYNNSRIISSLLDTVRCFNKLRSVAKCSTVTKRPQKQHFSWKVGMISCWLLAFHACNKNYISAQKMKYCVMINFTGVRVYCDTAVCDSRIPIITDVTDTNHIILHGLRAPQQHVLQCGNKNT